MAGSGEGMNRFSIDSLAQMLRGDHAAVADDVAPTDEMPKVLGIGTAVLVAAIVANIVLESSWLEFSLLVAIALLTLAITLLLKRHQWYHRALAFERRQLRTAV